jgi:hypothetical protein
LAVSRNYGDFVGESEQALVDGVQELVGVASGKVGAADGAGEESVPGEEEFLVGKVEADGAFGVSGGVEDGTRKPGDGYALAVFEGGVGTEDGGGWDAEPFGLDVHDFDQGQVVLVVEDGCAGDLFQAVGAGDVVDVGVGDDDLLDGEVVLGEQGEDARDVVSGVDDDCFAGGLVTEDGAVALEGAYGQGFENHGFLRVTAKGWTVQDRFEGECGFLLIGLKTKINGWYQRL